MELELAEKFKAYLNSMSQEEFDKEWAEIKSLGMEGPTVDELFSSWKPHATNLESIENRGSLEREHSDC